MKSVKIGAVSGCVVWVLLIGVISSCILPCFFVVGSVTSFSDYAIRTTGGFLCPEGSQPESYSYATTSTDEYGNSHPSTAYELHCVDAGGEVVKTDPIVYAFLWDGIFAVVGFIIAMGLSFLLAAPAGALIAKFLNKNRPQ